MDVKTKNVKLLQVLNGKLKEADSYIFRFIISWGCIGALIFIIFYSILSKGLFKVFEMA
jgi:hypothetical protein